MRRVLTQLVARPVGAGLLLAAVVGLGAVSLLRLPLAAMPPLERPVVRVEGRVPGVGMERLEAELVRRLEEGLLVLPGSDTLVTWCRDGLVAAEVGFRWGVEPERARLAVVEALDGLPAVVATPVEWRAFLTAVQDRPALILVVSGDLALSARSAVAEDVLLPAMTAVPGVVRVDLLGGVRRRTVVRPDPARLAAAGVAAGDIRETLMRAARQRRIGEVLVAGDEVEVVAAAGGGSTAAVAELEVSLGGGATSRLGELAEVREEEWPDHGIFHVSGKAEVGLAMHLDAGANALAVERALKRQLDNLGGRMAEGLQLERIADRLVELRAALRALLVAAAVGALVAGAILALFLRRLAPLAVLMLVIPLSLCAALPVFEALGLGLNLVSLVGMALAAGMLVDAAVVVVDACLGRAGPGPERAVEGTSSVARAIVASAVTTAVVFVPALYLRHLAAALFRQLAVALMVTLLASLVFALLAVPVVVARLAPAPDRGEEAVARAYRRWLSRLGARPWWALLAVLLCVLACGLMLPRLPQRLLAPEATTAVELRFVQPWKPWDRELPAGAVQVLASLRQGDEKDLFAIGLEARNGPPLPFGFWRLPGSRRQVEVGRLREALRTALPGSRVQAAGPAGGLLESLPLRPLCVEVSGRDRSAVAAAADRVAKAFRAAGISVVAGTTPTAVSLEVRPTELGRLAGDDLERALSHTLPAAEAPDSGSVRLDEGALAAQDPHGLPVTLAGGDARPLAALVRLEEVRRPAVLVRHRGQPAVRLEVGEATADVSLVEGCLSGVRDSVPDGVDVRAAGGILDWREARGELGLAVLLGLSLVFLVLAAIYESLRLPVAVMAVVPFAAMGGLCGQWWGGGGLDLGSGLGFVLLTGLAVNNGVLLLDRLHGCPGGPALWARRATGRLRPVLITTLTTMATLAPVALAGGAGSSLRATLARTVFAGLLVSTPAALFVLPPLARLLLRTEPPNPPFKRSNVQTFKRSNREGGGG
jgi:HAE1 family hydrophobic/amphiphilic exporter-1